MVALRRGWRDGPDLLEQRDRNRDAGIDIRLPGAHAADKGPAWHLAGSFGVFVLFVATLPVTLAIAGQTHTGGDFLAWQISRRPNHDLLFYPAVVTPAIGLLVVFAAVAGCLCLRRRATWRETLLLSWIVVPVLFFELWAVKGYQYLLPVAPAVALLAARALTSDQLWRVAASRVEQLGLPARFGRALADRRIRTAALAVVAISLPIRPCTGSSPRTQNPSWPVPGCPRGA